MELMHNQAIHIVTGELQGIYRIILDEPQKETTIIVRLDPPLNIDSKSIRGGRKRLDKPKNPRKKIRPPNVGKLIWMNRSILEELSKNKQIQIVEIEKRNITPSINNTKKKNDLYNKRIQAMEPFLSITTLRTYITPSRGISRLVLLAKEKSGLSKSNIYIQFSSLCRFGFSKKSLHPDFDKCGAPGVSRPCDPHGRKKAGAKTKKQKIAQHQGIILDPDQPGMNSDWTALILAADKSIPTPKPNMPDRATQIIRSAFITRYRHDERGNLEAIDPGPGTYPNRRQIQRVLERETPRIQHLLNKTTGRHFERSMRGMKGKSWKGVAGPGHTWAIDSTIGDMYLRSSINRAWIIGRPIVYIIVDEWSTAVVGFFVCLRGPSWDMAKLALFCSSVDPALVGSLWGYEPVLSLDPVPTLCANLLCDRGEYLSKSAKQTGIKLIPCESYTPPYRPDLKGLVEVLHRIEKEKQYHFVPGAIDARRKEFDLRRFNPHEAALTLREYVHYLHIIFTDYNLTASREHRMDAHMKADGVMPTPAGLWNWGHKVGIGMQRAITFTDLATELLPSADATVTRYGVMLGGKQYGSDLIDEQLWTTKARNFGSWKIPSNYFSGSVSTIWTPDTERPGLIQLDISDQSTASPELTWDEILDANEYYSIKNAEREHSRVMTNINAQKNISELVETATRLTQAAIERDKGSKPNITEARELERSFDTPNDMNTPSDSSDIITATEDEAEIAYFDAMHNLLESNNEDQ